MITLIELSGLLLEACLGEARSDFDGGYPWREG